MDWLKKQISKELWSPYAAGILLGIVGILAVLLSNKLLGASGAFENLAGMIGKAIAPVAFNNTYFNFVMPPGITWGVILLVGVFFGGMIGAATSKTLKWGKKDASNSDAQWKRIFGPADLETLGAGLLRRNIAGIRRRDCRRLHQRTGHLGRHVTGPGGLPLHVRDVRFRHRHRLDHLSQALLTRRAAMNYVIALVLGAFFGFSLNKAGLTKYNKIVNQFRFTDMRY